MNCTSDDFELEAQTAADLAALAAAEKSDGKGWPSTLAQLMDVTCAALVRGGEPEEKAEALARIAVIAQAHYIGGRSFYLPRGKALEIALRDDAIYRASRRGNTLALAQQYGLSDRAVQMIVRRQTLLHRARIQGRLAL
ncbi:hypothetical protein OS176_09475 [Xanthomonadaceae bacterium XH05]|nr:hypothetical protein [Xanthomonadaceae bacterium XH05]